MQSVRMQDFKNLRVWHEALRLSLNVLHSMDAKSYAKYPGKRSQTFRCAESIASNVAEGAVKSNAEFARYIDNALASAAELENHLIFARLARLIPGRRIDRLMERLDYVRRGLIKLLRRVRES